MEENWEVSPVESNFGLTVRSNKWEGEDEEEDVKDSWEDMDEEKKDVEKPAEVPKAKTKPKKSLADKIEEREKKAREESERKAKEKEEALTPEERRAEMQRRQRLQEEADLRLAMETFGVPEGPGGIDAMTPDNAAEFDAFAEALTQKINNFNKHTDFPPFAEELMKNIAVSLPSTSLKRVKTLIDSMLAEKLKMEKGDKGKKKGKGKAKLKIEGENTHLNDYDAYGYNEFDEFM